MPVFTDGALRVDVVRQSVTSVGVNAVVFCSVWDRALAVTQGTYRMWRGPQVAQSEGNNAARNET